jgi:N-acetylglucosaminyl-diphospho-decaprenol L-rhamnosyltransferase
MEGGGGSDDVAPGTGCGGHVSPSLQIVIVNWNTGEHLRACLDSIAAASKERFTLERVTVVDNDSRDGSSDDLAADVPLEVVRNRDNRGFAAACNQGAREIETDYILFLNPDTRLFPDTLDTTIAYMESQQAAGIGICGVEVLGDAGAPIISCSRFPTLRVFIGKMTGLDAVVPSVFPPHHLPPSETAESRVVDQVIGAFYLVRGDLYATLGGFDERYFVYFEDVDFALRALEHGARTFFLKEARVFHVGGGSSDQVPATRLSYSLASRITYARRHWPAWHANTLVALIFSVELVARLGRAAFRRSTEEVRATVGGYARLLAELAEGGESPSPDPPPRP